MACLAACISTTHQLGALGAHVLRSLKLPRITLGSCSAHRDARAMALALAYADACGKASSRGVR
jgi:hypothetical protein